MQTYRDDQYHKLYKLYTLFVTDFARVRGMAARPESDKLALYNFYVDPPGSQKMRFPAFVCNRMTTDVIGANNIPYLYRRRYEVTLIRAESTRYEDYAPADITSLLETIRNSSHDRRFIQNGLVHDVFTIYI